MSVHSIATQRFFRKAFAIIFGVVLGLLLTEYCFVLYDKNAFPHVNFYKHDPVLGARLIPNTTQKFQLVPNPITTIHTNSQGYRGNEFLAKAKNEILVVGDSQVFGLGVEDDETFSSVLRKLLKRSVINAGIPTYGPQEYMVVAEEFLKKRKPRYLFFTINYANDAFEVKRPNTKRHKIWDSWAVRIETAPKNVFRFPGRNLIFRHSHIVYHFRRVYYYLQKPKPQSLPSEGTWTDLLEEHMFNGRILTKIQTLESKEKVLQESRIGPQDIVHSQYSEAARPIEYTSQEIDKAAKELQIIDKKLSQLKKHRIALEKKVYSHTHDRSVFDGTLKRLKKLGKKYYVTPVVLILPLDVQVSAKEWKKYKIHKPIDMKPTRILLARVARNARRLQIPVINLTRTLAKASPGAFLDHDLHMTPKGHKAVAQTLAKFIKRWEGWK
ncbi:MAG: hypothetical protein AAF518_15130 [Spirochaetota bacterium]